MMAGNPGKKMPIFFVGNCKAVKIHPTSKGVAMPTNLYTTGTFEGCDLCDTGDHPSRCLRESSTLLSLYNIYIMTLARHCSAADYFSKSSNEVA